jgi:uncharacterized RDD family membrane protein YckC
MQNIVEFKPYAVAATFFERTASVFVDYSLLLAVPVTWLIALKYFGESGTSGGLGSSVWWLTIVVYIANFILLPLLRAQTVGKMLFGLRILDANGNPPAPVKILMRSTFGYLLTALTGGIGFLMAGVNRSGRTLHDIVFKTLVIRARAKQI